jgi:riboflavin kinase / FMN adenylyltransferase
MRIDITGKVIQGDKYGRKLGFPTANLDRREFIRRKLKVKLGVYGGCAVLLHPSHLTFDPKPYKAAIVIGPIDKTGRPKIEAHLISFKGNLYGKKLSLTLIKYLRPFKKFKNEQNLKFKIKRDIERIKLLNF